MIKKTYLKSSAAFYMMILSIVLSAFFVSSSTAFAASGSGPENVLVLCEDCYIAGVLPPKFHVMLMDKKTGEIWAYSQDAIGGKELPVYVGTLTNLGQKIEKKR